MRQLLSKRASRLIVWLDESLAPTRDFAARVGTSLQQMCWRHRKVFQRWLPLPDARTELVEKPPNMSGKCCSYEVRTQSKNTALCANLFWPRQDNNTTLVENLVHAERAVFTYFGSARKTQYFWIKRVDHAKTPEQHWSENLAHVESAVLTKFVSVRNNTILDLQKLTASLQSSPPPRNLQNLKQRNQILQMNTECAESGSGYGLPPVRGPWCLGCGVIGVRRGGGAQILQIPEESAEFGSQKRNSADQDRICRI